MSETKNFFDILVQLKQEKKVVVLSVIVSVLLATAIAFILPNTYKSTILAAPVSDDMKGGTAGKLASLAGIGLGNKGAVSKLDLMLARLESKGFVLDFIKKYDLAPLVMGLEGWDPATNTNLINDSIYDVQNNKWVMNEGSGPLKTKMYKEFLDNYSSSVDAETGLITISYTSYSPILAQKWVTMLVAEVNEIQRERDIYDAEEQINFLRKQMAETRITEINAVFAKMLEEALKTRMLANTRKEYFLTTVDPAMVPELKSGPLRALIMIVGLFAGLAFAVLRILWKENYRIYRQRHANKTA